MQAGSVLDRFADAPGESGVECQPTEPVPVDDDHDGSKTLAHWLGIQNLYYLALGELLQRFSEIVGSDELALNVFRRVAEVKRTNPRHPGFVRPKGPTAIEAGFEKLAKVMRCDLFQVKHTPTDGGTLREI